MTTQYKKAMDLMDQIQKGLSEETSTQRQDTVKREEIVKDHATQLASITDDVAKMKKRALETDPDRVTYGKAMAAKVLAMANRYAALQGEIHRVVAEAERAAAPERAARAEAAAAAQRAADEAAAAEAARLAEEAAEQLRKEAEAKAEAAKQKLLAEKRKASAVARLAAQKEAKKRAEMDAKCKAAEEVRLKEERKAKERADAERRRREERAEKESKLQEEFLKRRAALLPTAAPVPTPTAPPRRGGRASISVLDTPVPPPPRAEPAAGTVPRAANPNAHSLNANFQSMDAFANRFQEKLGELGPGFQALYPQLLQENRVLHLENGGAELKALFATEDAPTKLFYVAFSAEWCGPCRQLATILDNIAPHFPRMVFVHVDAEKPTANQLLAQEAQIAAFPTIHMYSVSTSGVATRIHARQGAGGLSEMLDELYGALAKDIVPRLAAALALMKARVSEPEFLEAVRTLLDVVSEMLNESIASPKEPAIQHFWRLSTSDGKLDRNLLRKPWGIGIIQVLGFHPGLEEDNTLMFYQRFPGYKPYLHLLKVKELLGSATGTTGASTSSAVPPPVPSTSQAPPSTPVPMDEDEELALAIALSLEDAKNAPDAEQGGAPPS